MTARPFWNASNDLTESLSAIDCLHGHRPIPAATRSSAKSNRGERMISENSLGRWAPYALAVLRIMTALLFMAHGTAKLLGFPDLGFSPEVMSLSWIAGLLELVGGVLLVLGLFTRPVAFILSGEMAVAYFMAHASQGFFPIQNGGELAVIYCFVFLYFVFSGPGAWSLDRRKATA
jgi:putative oxidoreductase